MDRTQRWGITLPLHGLSLPDQREIVTALPILGYTDAWSAELNGVDAFTPLVLASQWTNQLRLGTAIAPIYTRGPALLAMTAGTLADLAPGRFILGIGTSTPVVVKEWNDISFEAPYERSRDRWNGFSNGIPFHCSTATCDDVPIPITNRPGARLASVAALTASATGARV